MFRWGNPDYFFSGIFPKEPAHIIGADVDGPGQSFAGNILRIILVDEIDNGFELDFGHISDGWITAVPFCSFNGVVEKLHFHRCFHEFPGCENDENDDKKGRRVDGQEELEFPISGEGDHLIAPDQAG